MTPHVAAPRIELEEKSGVHRLPMMIAGPGERHDECAHYDGCLGRARRLSDAHCPPGCADYEPEPPHVRIARAHAYGVRPTPTSH